MKKFLLILLFIVFMVQLCMASFTTSIDEKKTWKNAYRFTNKPKDKFLDWCQEVEDRIDGTTGFSYLYLIPSTEPASTEGNIYYNSSTQNISYYNGASWLTLGISSSGTLDEAYNAGHGIDVDGTAVTLTVSDGDNNAGLIVAQNDSTNDPDAMNITSAADSATAVGLQIDCTAGFDIQGTSDSWNISIAGLFGGEGLTGLTNSQSILFDTNNEIQFGDNSEDVAMVFSTNTVTWATDTGVDSMAFGDVDDLEGVGTIVFDAAASSITCTADAGAEDLTISQAGAVDASLILTSAGTGTDAVSISTSNADGDIKVASADNIDIDAADDIAIDTADGSISITAAGAVNGDYTLTVGDDYALVGTSKIEISNSGAGEDITIDSALGSISIEAEEDAANALQLIADGGTSSTLKIFNDTGTSVAETAASVQILSDVGGISLVSNANLAKSIQLVADGGVDEYIYIQSDQGTGADSITLLSDVGGITATASAGPVAITASGASAGDLTISAGDVMNITHVDKAIFSGAAAETWEIEGTADDHEATVVFTDPTADITWTFPTGAADTLAVMSSTLATNIPEAANSVTGGTNQLIFEGTADDHETILTATDATADATLTLPDDTGTIVYTAEAGSATKDNSNADLPLTDAVVLGTSGAASAWGLPDGENGQILSVVIVTDGGEATITPATSSGWATAVLTDAIDQISFMYVNDTVGWIILGTSGDGTNTVEITQ